MRNPTLPTGRPRGQAPNSPRAMPISDGPDEFQREHEMCDALLRLLIAHSRYATNSDAERLPLVAHIVVLLAHEIAERVHNINGKEAGRAFRKALARNEPPQ